MNGKIINIYGKDYLKMNKGFDALLAKISECSMKKVSVANAQDDAVLEAVRAAKDKNIADAILVGDEDKIKEIAASKNIDVSDFEMVDVKDMIEAARTAVKLVHDGKAVGLRTGNPLSHVAVFEVEGYDRLLFLSDVAFIPYPTLEDKVGIIKNTVEVAQACGIACPKVAPVAAVEVVNPKMPVTVEAAELTKMNEEGQIEGCIVDGPLSLDLAIDPEAARHKGATGRKIVGDADVILFPDIHAGNLVYKCLVHTANVKNGCILTGTKAPVILTSRSDEFETKVNSIALAAIVAEELSKTR